MTDFISTGLQELDEELGGGLPKGAVTLFGGESVAAKQLGRRITNNISGHKKVRIISGKENTFEGVATEVFHGVQEADFLFLVSLGLAESPADSPLAYLAQGYNQLFRSCSFEGKAILIHYGGKRFPIGLDYLASHRFDVTQDNNGYLLQHTKNRFGDSGNYVRISVRPKVVIPSRFNRKCLLDV
jgi:hypothetical protein